MCWNDSFTFVLLAASNTRGVLRNSFERRKTKTTIISELKDKIFVFIIYNLKNNIFKLKKLQKPQTHIMQAF